jgi:chloramphenicol-sensitive protein RarD
LNETTKGFLYTLGAFLIWGLSPIFWKMVGHVPASELVAHRIVWCALFLGGVLTWQRSWGSLAKVLAHRKTLAALLVTTLLISGNWFLFIWAVHHDNLLEASLGYFINPLVSVVLGLVFLGERLRPWQWFSLLLASSGVLFMTLRLGKIPWTALALALSFGFYALVRKQIRASPEEGLFFECILLVPLMLIVLGRRELAGTAAWGHANLLTHVLLVLTGILTLVPLVWFHHGAKRLALSTVGLLQYLAPTGQFLLAIGVYGESFETPHLIAFALIWTALIFFTLDARAAWKRGREPAAPGAD